MKEFDAECIDCLVCEHATQPLAQPYLVCLHCEYIFKHPSVRISVDEEKIRYEQHNNSPDDERYIAYLSPIVACIQNIHTPPAVVLDYGCGPSPVLSTLFREAGYEAHFYDPIFYPDASTKGDFDAITCIEAAEHFFNPVVEFRRMYSLLSPGGVLLVKTQPHPGPDSIADWWYAGDPTHVGFFAEKTFSLLAENLSCRLSRPQSDYFLLVA